MNQEQVTEDLVRQNGNQAAAVMADYAGQGGGDHPTPTPPPYTPDPHFDIDTILSGFPLSDKSGDPDYIGDAFDFPFKSEPEEFSNMTGGGVTLIGSYYYSGESKDFSLPIGFGAGNYLCYAIFLKRGGVLYMAPVETMAFRKVALLVLQEDAWNVTPIN